jgi:hypothetical protein
LKNRSGAGAGAVRATITEDPFGGAASNAAQGLGRSGSAREGDSFRISESTSATGGIRRPFPDRSCYIRSMQWTTVPFAATAGASVARIGGSVLLILLGGFVIFINRSAPEVLLRTNGPGMFSRMFTDDPLSGPFRPNRVALLLARVFMGAWGLIAIVGGLHLALT